MSNEVQVVEEHRWDVGAVAQENIFGQTYYYPRIGDYTMRSRACDTPEEAISIGIEAALDLPR